MTQRLLRTSVLTALAIALLLAVAPAGPSFVHSAQPELVEKIAFASARDTPSDPTQFKIYLMNPDGTNPEPLTGRADCLLPTFPTCGDSFPVLSPDGKRIVFDSNRNKAPAERINTSDLFVMNPDGTEQTFLTRGSSATWRPVGNVIAFHRSASGTGEPINNEQGGPTSDSDIFAMDIGAGGGPTNITNTPTHIEDDANWSPGGRQIVYVRHVRGDDPRDPNNFLTAELYVLTVNPDGTPVKGPNNPRQLTFNTQEERGPAWSPDGTRIAFMCRMVDFEICVVNANTGVVTQLTNNSVFDGTPSWSLDGQQILYNRGGPGAVPPGQDIFKINADGTGETNLTHSAGGDVIPAWGVVRVVGRAATPTPASTPTVTPTPTSTPTVTPTPTSSTPTVTPTPTPDTTAPDTAIDGGPEGTTTSTDASFSFSASEPGSSFQCSLDGGAFEPCSSPREYGGLAVGNHEFRVQATDGAGNTDDSPASFGWTVQPPPDTTAPDTWIDSGPPDGDATGTASFAFGASEAATFTCSLDGGAFQPCGSPAQYTGLAVGYHEFQVQATDGAGNTDQSPAIYGWNVVPPPDTTAPDTWFDSGPPPTGDTTGTAVFTFGASEQATFECSLDGAAFSPCAPGVQYTGLAAGPHTFAVRAIDGAGNIDQEPADYQWTVEPPEGGGG